MAVGQALGAAEAYVLLSLPRTAPAKAVKLGLLALIVQGLVRMETVERRVMLRRMHDVHLYASPDPAPVLQPAAASLLGIVRAAGPDGSMSRVVALAKRAYGGALGGFVKDHVAPVLIERGLATYRPARILGLFPTTRLGRTATGEAERERLERAIRDAREIPRFLDRDPVQAAALAAALGGAILLIDELRPHYEALAAAVRRYAPGDDIGSGDGGGADFADVDRSGGFDFANVDLDAVDFSGIDFGGFDSGFSDAGGEGGGDGGGDGGSSGC